jgi:hypothetical protein
MGFERSFAFNFSFAVPEHVYARNAHAWSPSERALRCKPLPGTTWPEPWPPYVRRARSYEQLQQRCLLPQQQSSLLSDRINIWLVHSSGFHIQRHRGLEEAHMAP